MVLLIIWLFIFIVYVAIIVPIDQIKWEKERKKWWKEADRKKKMEDDDL